MQSWNIGKTNKKQTKYYKIYLSLWTQDVCKRLLTLRKVELYLNYILSFVKESEKLGASMYLTCGLEVYYSKNLLFTSFRNNQGDWSTEGCFVNETTTNYTTCHCYHLTNFAVLMSLTEKGTALIIVRKYSNMYKKPHGNVIK